MKILLEINTEKELNCDQQDKLESTIRGGLGTFLFGSVYPASAVKTTIIRDKDLEIQVQI